MLSKGIRPYVDGSGVGECFSVKEIQARSAVTAIAENPELQGHGILLNKAFLSFEMTNVSEVKIGNETWLDISRTQK